MDETLEHSRVVIFCQNRRIELVSIEQMLSERVYRIRRVRQEHGFDAEPLDVIVSCRLEKQI